MAVLQDFLDNIAALLEDTAHTYYTDAQITVGLRWSLSEYAKLNPGDPYAIDDLDGAGATTLAEADWKNVEVGAAGYTALVRSMSRVETINMEPDVSDHLKSLSQSYLTSFYGGDLAVENARIAAATALEDQKDGHITARDAALDADAIAMEELKAGHSTDLQAAKAVIDLARDAALDTDAIAMEELKDGHVTTRENAKYAADINLEQERLVSALDLEAAKALNTDALEDVKIAAQTARDAALDADNISMEELKAGHAIDLQSAKASDQTDLQSMKETHSLTLEEIKRMNALGKDYLARFSLALTPDPGIQVAELHFPSDLSF